MLRLHIISGYSSIFELIQVWVIGHVVVKVNLVLPAVFVTCFFQFLFGRYIAQGVLESLNEPIFERVLLFEFIDFRECLFNVRKALLKFFVFL